MSAKLAIDQAPKAAPRIEPEMLHPLNEAMHQANEAVLAAQLAEARLRLARIEAEVAQRAFVALRQRAAEAVGVALGETHGWDRVTGEVREVPKG